MTGYYDLQVHTNASPCSTATPDEMVAAAVEADLDRIAITDHDTMANIDAAREAAPDGFDVIPGVEVTTTQGHLLALGVSTPPAPHTDPLAVIDDIHGQGGYAVLSHPFDILRESYDDSLESIAAAVDGVETVNSRCVRRRYNRRAATFAAQHQLARVDGSDAHFPMEVGRAFTIAERPVLESLAADDTTAGGRGGYLTGHVATKLHQARSRLR